MSPSKRQQTQPKGQLFLMSSGNLAPARQGPREATVVIRWTEDQDKFYDRLLATLAGSPGFRGIDPKEFEYYSDTEPGLRAFSDSLATFLWHAPLGP